VGFGRPQREPDVLLHVRWARYLSLLLPVPSRGEEDDGGVASWVLVLAGVGGGIVVVGAGVLALRRFG
jgi:hypothetical protein